MRYVDVNVFVYWLGDDPEFGGKATKIIESIEAGEESITSALTPWLTHVVLQALTEGYSAKEMMRRFRQLEFLRVTPLTLQTYLAAVTNAQEQKLDFEDAIHYSAAREHGATEIYSNDQDFKRTPLKPVGFS